MQVLCVQSFEIYRPIATDLGTDLPTVGSEYNAVDTQIVMDGTPCYVLAEFPENMSFDCRAFAILPCETATEFYNEAIEAIIM